MKKISILGVLGLMMAFTSCTKYEEGPGISLRSRTERVANTWTIEKAYDGDDDVTEAYDEFIVQFLSNGQTEIAAIYSFGDVNLEFETDGTWDFTDDMESIVVDYENDEADGTYRILRLYETELWLLEEGTGVELRLLPY